MLSSSFLFQIAAKVVTDRVSGFSKGFGFVKYASTEEAAKGIEGMDGKVWLLNIYLVLYCRSATVL